MTLDNFIKWVEEKPGRSISIKIGENDRLSALPKINSGQVEITVFAYDHKLQAGQYVTSAEEIDLEKKKEREDYQKYLELKKRYEVA